MAGNGRKLFMGGELRLCDHCGQIVSQTIEKKLKEIEQDENDMS